MINKKELLRSLIGKEVVIRFAESGSGASISLMREGEERLSFSCFKIIEIGEDVFNALKTRQPEQGSIAYYSIDSIIVIVPE